MPNLLCVHVTCNIKLKYVKLYMDRHILYVIHYNSYYVGSILYKQKVNRTNYSIIHTNE